MISMNLFHKEIGNMLSPLGPKHGIIVKCTLNGFSFNGYPEILSPVV